MGGGGGGSHRVTQQTNVIQYAPYIQYHHENFLGSMADQVTSHINVSPFSSFSEFEIEDVFFGSGNTIADYNSLFPMFDTFVTDVDLDVEYTNILNSTLNNQTVKDLVVAEGALMSDDIEQNAIPRMSVGARNINSSLSTTFITGRTLIEEGRQKNLSKFSAELKYNLLPIATERWTTSLNWKKNVVATYSELLKFYFSSHLDINEYNYEMKTKDALWPFTILDHQRAALAALQGAKSSSQDVMGSVTSKGQKALSGALSGAAMGAQVGMNMGSKGGLWGAAIGAVVGGVAGYYS